MVSKKYFDTLFASYIKAEPYLNIICLVDNEGLTLSYAIKSRKYKIKSESLGSALRQSLYPLINFGRILRNEENSIMQLYIFEKNTLFVFNLGIGILGLLVDVNNWPLDITLFTDLLKKLQNQINKSFSLNEGLLSKLELVEKVSSNEKEFSDKRLKMILESIKLLEQKFNDNSISSDILLKNNEIQNDKIEEFLNTISSKTNTLIIKENQQFNTNSDLYSKEFVDITIEIAKNIEFLSIFNSGQFLMGYTCLSSSNIAFSGIGTISGASIFIFKSNFQENILFFTYFNLFNSIINNAELNFKEYKSNSLRNKLDYLQKPLIILDKLIRDSEEIDKKELHIQYLERAAILSQRENIHFKAGNYYREIGKILVESKEYKRALRRFEDAIAHHQVNNNMVELGEDYELIAKIYNEQGHTNLSLDSYNKSELKYTQANKPDLANKIKKIKEDLLETYSVDIQNFINQASSEILKIDYISMKLNLGTKLIIEILNKLIEKGEIEGSIDNIKGRYVKTVSFVNDTKRVQNNNLKLEQENNNTFNSIDNEVNYTNSPIKLIKPNLVKDEEESLLSTPIEVKILLESINSSINTLEQKLSVFLKNINLYNEYDTLIGQQEFLMKKLSILEDYSEILNLDRKTKQCIICFMPIGKNEEVSSCPNNHYYHPKCMSDWIKKQKYCPICDKQLLPYILKLNEIN